MEKPYYVSTAISYVNGPPHLGHALEFVIADVIKRFHELKGEQVFLLTGTDEHGQKIERTAQSRGISPSELCQENHELFVSLNKKLNVDYDRFIRTSDEDHREFVKLFYSKCKKDIYLGQYAGWYDVKEERFVSKVDAMRMGYKDSSGKELEHNVESSYFFKLSRYRSRIIKFLEENDDFIVPRYHRDSVLKRLEEGLEDLSISRTSVKWGIQVPNDNDHTLYVWFDALINYLSGCDYWPCDVHVIGKDIVWFHSVVWLGMLMSAGFQLPKRIYVHNFLTDDAGRKMSKSVGNVIDPIVLSDKYPSSAIRCYLMYSLNDTIDIKFAESGLVKLHDNFLLGDYGNLVNRVFGLFHKYCGGIVPDGEPTNIFDVGEIRNELSELMDSYQIQSYFCVVINLVRAMNLYVNETKVWEIAKKGGTLHSQQKIIRTLMENLFTITHFLYPLMPDKCTEVVVTYYGSDLKMLNELNNHCLESGIKIEKRKTLLFEIIDKDLYECRKKRNIKRL